MKFFKNNKGFTLVELVVVIAILGILAGIAIPRFMDATATARGARIVADLRTIDSAIVMYQAKEGKFPSATTDLTTTAAGSSTTQAKYQLIASWPVPPTGTAKITNNSNVLVEIPAATAYTLSTAKDRAEYGTGKNVDELLKTGVTTTP